MGNLLSRVTSTAQALPSRVFLYAREKWGKSSLFAHAPGAIFFMTRGETGLIELISSGRVPQTPHFDYDEQQPPTWNTLRQAVRELRDDEHGHKFFVIDTWNGAEILCQEHVRNAKPFNGNVHAFNAYGKGMEACRVEWLGLLQDLDALRAKRKMTIVLLAHSQVKKFDDPTTEESYDKYRPACAEKLWDLTHKWADIICFGHFKAQTYETDSGKTKAKNEVQRVLCFDQSPLWEAGNRYGLTGELPVGDGAKAAFNRFAAAVSKAKAAHQTAPGGKPATTSPPAAPPAEAPEGEQRPDPTPASASTVKTPSPNATATSPAPSAEKPAAPAASAATKSPSSPSTASSGDEWPAELSELEKAWAGNTLDEIRDAFSVGDVQHAISVMPAKDKLLPIIAKVLGLKGSPTASALHAATRPAPRPAPSADRRTAPAKPPENPAFPLLELMHELDLSWPEIRDARGKGLDVSNAAGLGKLPPQTRVTDLDDSARGRLFRELEARVAQKRQRAKQREANKARREAEAAAEEVSAS